MYENLYKQMRTEADNILAGVHDTSPERSSARAAASRGLAARTTANVTRAMEQTALDMLDNPMRNPDVLKKKIAEYIASIDENYDVDEEPEEEPATPIRLPRGVEAPPMRSSTAVKAEGAKTKTTEMGIRLMRDLMKDYGLNQEYAAGIVGNLDYETGGFKYMQEIAPLVKGSRGGFGIAQWTGPRRVAFEKYAKENGLDPTSYEANYGFLKHELGYTKEGNFLDEYEYIYDPEQAARVFSKYYLRPSARHANIKERINRANAYASLKLE
jgi:hypothetical protein